MGDCQLGRLSLLPFVGW